MVIGLFSSITALAGVGTRGGDRPSSNTLNNGESARCEDRGRILHLIRCEEITCDDESLCKLYGFTLKNELSD